MFVLVTVFFLESQKSKILMLILLKLLDSLFGCVCFFEVSYSVRIFLHLYFVQRSPVHPFLNLIQIISENFNQLHLKLTIP